MVRGEALYQPLDRPPYTIATYTPLYYWVAAALRLVFGPGFVSGRLVSLASGLAVAVFVAMLVLRRTRATVPAVVAGLLFVAVGMGGTVPWSAAYKEDLFAVALAVASVAVLDAACGPAMVMAAAVLAAASFLTKQSLLGPAVFGTAWLIVAHRPKLAALYASSVVVLSLGVLITLQVIGTSAVWENVVGGNLHQPFDALTFDYNLRQLAIFLGVPLVLALGYALRRRRKPPDVLVLGWLGAWGPLLAFGAIGGYNRYWLL